MIDGDPVDLEDLWSGTIGTRFGKPLPHDKDEMIRQAVRGPGVCAAWRPPTPCTASSRRSACRCPARPPVRANSRKMFDAARESGRRIVEMIAEDLTPRAIMTPGAFRNAVATVLAVSGSINAIKHLQAIAVESGVDIDIFRLWDEVGRQVPILSAVRPSGEVRIEQFEDAGGARAILKQLEPLLDLEALTCSGERMGEILGRLYRARSRDHSPARRSRLARPLHRHPQGHARARERGREARHPRTVRGPSFSRGAARCFDDNASCLNAIEKREVKPGDVVILRGQGLKGGPAMAGGASLVLFALDAAGIARETAFVTDCQLSGLCFEGPDRGGKSRRKRPMAVRSGWSRTATASVSTSPIARSTCSSILPCWRPALPRRRPRPRAISASISARCSPCRRAPCWSTDPLHPRVGAKAESKGRGRCALFVCCQSRLLALPACADAAPRPSLEQRVQRMEDESAIRRILIDYGAYLDGRDYAAYAGLFAKDGIWIGGFGTFKGPAAIRKMLVDNLGLPEPGWVNKSSFHMLTNPIIEIDGDHAHVTSKYLFWTKSADDKPTPMLAGRYVDEFSARERAMEDRQAHHLRRDPLARSRSSRGECAGARRRAGGRSSARQPIQRGSSASRTSSLSSASSSTMPRVSMHRIRRLCRALRQGWYTGRTARRSTRAPPTSRRCWPASTARQGPDYVNNESYHLVSNPQVDIIDADHARAHSRHLLIMRDKERASGAAPCRPL